jgi:hypothetical protein
MEPEGSLQLPFNCFLYPVYFRSILVLSSLLFLGVRRGLFHSGLLTEIVYAYLISPRCATCPIYPVFWMIALLIFPGHYKVWSFSLCGFLCSLCSPLFGPNMLLSALFWKPLNLGFFSLRMRDQVSFLPTQISRWRYTVLYFNPWKFGITSEMLVELAIIAYSFYANSVPP